MKEKRRRMVRTPKEKEQGEKEKEGKGHGSQKQQMRQQITLFDNAKIDARVSHLPQVHEVGCSDPVGQSLLMSVSKVPIGACRVEGRDGVSLRSFSTKVWTLCPVSCRSILGHRRGSKDEPDQEA